MIRDPVRGVASVASGPAVLTVALVLLAGGGCGGTSARVPLADPVEVARTARAHAPDGAWRLTLEWEYADPRGPVAGDGVLRYTAPDSLRLDLLGPGDGSIAAALTGEGLRSVGQIQEVRLPPPPFLYAAAGLFRPAAGRPDRAWREREERVLLYRRDDAELVFRLEAGRLVRVEEREGDRTVRRLELTWPDSAGSTPWPATAEFRDHGRESRARWTVRRARPADGSFPPEIYDLAPSP